MRHEFHPEALAEFEDGALYYEGKRAGLGLRFAANVEAAIGRVVSTPSSFPVLEQDVRRCLTRIFPYAVLYTVEQDYILIVAVMHCRRQPGYWRHRAGS